MDARDGLDVHGVILSCIVSVWHGGGGHDFDELQSAVASVFRTRFDQSCEAAFSDERVLYEIDVDAPSHEGGGWMLFPRCSAALFVCVCRNPEPSQQSLPKLPSGAPRVQLPSEGRSVLHVVSQLGKDVPEP